jgi:hypothetical protein
MADERWEHCKLVHRRMALGGAEAQIEVKLTYYGLTNFTEAVPADSYGRAIGQLGQDGWELVSATAGAHFEDDNSAGVTTLYFKRRAGRNINQPMLSL